MNVNGRGVSEIIFRSCTIKRNVIKTKTIEKRIGGFGIKQFRHRGSRLEYPVHLSICADACGLGST